MPWTTPTLRKVREMVRDDISASLYGAAFIGNNVLRVMADAMAGLTHHTLRYIDWLALQLLPLTAETEWLDRHGEIWLVNADGTVGRKMPTFAIGSVYLTGTGGSFIPIGTRLSSNLTDVGYETLELVVLGFDAPTPARVRALDAGKAGNLDADTVVSVDTPPVGVDTTATVITLVGGTDIETDDQLRMRVLKRIREPPMGGSKSDYEKWALSFPGVTRAWCGPLEMGIGTVTVRFLMDDLRADNDGWPTQEDLTRVSAYLDSVRPVAVKDIWVLAPVKQFIDIYINKLIPDNAATRGAVEGSIRTMLRELAAPGQTIYEAWVSYAIMNTLGVTSFYLHETADYVMESPGHMAVLGSIFYDTPSQPAGEG